MDSGPAPRRLNEAGLASLQFVVAAGLALIVVVGLAQVMAYQYARGAVMVALERGARAGAAAGAGALECRLAVADSLREVLGGDIGRSLAVDCRADASTVRASGRGSVPSWLPGVEDWSFDVEAVARRELLP